MSTDPAPAGVSDAVEDEDAELVLEVADAECFPERPTDNPIVRQTAPTAAPPSMSFLRLALFLFTASGDTLFDWESEAGDRATGIRTGAGDADILVG